MHQDDVLFQPFELPCGVVLKNRIAKSAMSDSLGDGTGHPTPEQNRLYRRWAEGRLALAIIGEVQATPDYAEKPGNLVLNAQSDMDRFRTLAAHGGTDGAQLWLQLGHAGALAFGPTSRPKGPSALNLPGLTCAELSVDEIRALPKTFGETARLAQDAGFGGVQIHAAHGFLLSQFLSPLFNKRQDAYGGSISDRMKLLLECIEGVRLAVGPNFPIAVKLNASDQLEGGLVETDSLKVVAALESSSVDLIDISGGTYFPGAKSASDRAGQGPYFIEFAARARTVTSKPLMLTGGFKTFAQAERAVGSGAVDIVGLARAFVLEPSLAKKWMKNTSFDADFPNFSKTVEGGVTAWYTMRLTDIGADRETGDNRSIDRAIKEYEARDAKRSKNWLSHFGGPDSLTG